MFKMVKINIVRGDITNLDVDVVVNAANHSLLGGGGVDGAIHRRAGPALLEECKLLRRKLPDGLPTGAAVITRGYNLPAKFVIHTVGPVFTPSRNQDKLLENCFVNSLKMAEQQNLKSVAFPAISCGAYGYPVDRCALIAKKVMKEFDFKSVKEVTLCLYNNDVFETFRKILKS